MRDGVSVILIRKEDEAILIQHRSPDPDISYPDYWDYPGGAVDEEDKGDFEGGARRELLEETGYIADKLYLLSETNFTRSDGRVLRKHTYYAIYDGKQKIINGEGLEMKFLTLDEFRKKKFVPGQDEFCRLALERARENGLTREIKPERERMRLA